MNKKIKIILYTCTVIFSIWLIALIAVIATGCNRREPAQPATKSDTYVVTRDTGLYDGIYATSEQIGILKKGTRLQPFGGKMDCETATIESVTMILCHMKTSGTLEKGWVLNNAMERQ